MNYGKKVTQGWTDSRPSRMLDDDLWIMEEKVTKGVDRFRANYNFGWQFMNQLKNGVQRGLTDWRPTNHFGWKLRSKSAKGAWHIQGQLGWDPTILWITQKWPSNCTKSLCQKSDPQAWLANRKRAMIVCLVGKP